MRSLQILLGLKNYKRLCSDAFVVHESRSKTRKKSTSRLSKRAVATLIKVMTDLIPTDSLEVLHIHKRLLSPYRSRFPELVGDYNAIATARSVDLKRLNSRGVSVLGGKTVTEEVRSWIELLDVGGGQRIPAAMQSAFMFRKEYVHQYLLPAIALHRQPDLQLERARRQLVEKLSDENKIPAMLYMQFAEKFCESQVKQAAQDSMSMKDKMSDLDLMLAGIPRLAIRLLRNVLALAQKKIAKGQRPEPQRKRIKIPKDEWKNSLSLADAR